MADEHKIGEDVGRSRHMWAHRQLVLRPACGLRDERSVRPRCDDGGRSGIVSSEMRWHTLDEASVNSEPVPTAHRASG